MKAMLTRRFLLTLTVVAALAVPFSTLWGAAGERPVLESMLAKARPQVAGVTVDQAKQMLASGGWTLLDVRSDSEWAKGYIPGAKHVDRGKLEFMIERTVPDKGTPILVYCMAGDRGALAAVTLKEMGYTSVKNIDGGIQAWAKAGYPVVQ